MFQALCALPSAPCALLFALCAMRSKMQYLSKRKKVMHVRNERPLVPSMNVANQLFQIYIFLAQDRLACPVKSKWHDLMMWKDPESGQSSARYFRTMII